MSSPEELPPYSGERTTCPKCGHNQAVTRHRHQGEPRGGEVVLLARAAKYPERLERECWRCDFAWDEALADGTSHVAGPTLDPDPDAAATELAKLREGLHKFRYALDSRAGRETTTDFMRAMLDDMLTDPGEPCDRDEQYARAEQAEDLLRIAHETSNRSEVERARAVQRAERAEAVIKRVRAAIADRPPLLVNGRPASDYERGWRDAFRVMAADLDGAGEAHD